MKISLFWVLKMILVFAMFGFGLWFYEALPSQIPTHWNVAGEIDKTTDKSFWSVFFIPLLTAGIMIFMPVIAKLDPRKEKYTQFRKPWEILQLIILSFFGYLYFISLYIALHPEQSINTLIMIGLGSLFLFMGNYMGKIRQNYFVGIKTPWTLHNETVWNKTHRLAGWCFVFSGLIFLAEAYFQWQLMAVFIASLIISVVIPIGYSYWIFQKQAKTA